MTIDYKRILAVLGSIFLILNAKYQWFAAKDASDLTQNVIEVLQMAVGAYLMFATKPPPAIQIGDGNTKPK